MSFSVSFFTVIRETVVVFFGYFLTAAILSISDVCSSQEGVSPTSFWFWKGGMFLCPHKSELGKISYP